tara:strand:- start:323 stop:667 length:345 start_codon:yes stop_codon:yes gene_type:complete
MSVLNDMGVDPYEWFDNPLDSMPIATNDRFDMYGSSDADYAYMKAQVTKRKDPPPEFLEVPTSVTNPKPPEKKEEVKTPHHIAYEIATAKYNPFSVGGSESIHDFEGGSENHVK